MQILIRWSKYKQCKAATGGMVQLDIDENHASGNVCEVLCECNEYNVMQYKVKRKCATSCIVDLDVYY